MHLVKGERVFLTDTNSYGNIVRYGILGLKMSSSIVVLTDNGRMKAYTAKKTCCIVNLSTKKNDMGETFELPLDLRSIGSSILSEQRVSNLKQNCFFSKYNELEHHKQIEYLNEWNIICLGSHNEKTTFIMNMMKKLEILKQIKFGTTT